MSALLAAEQRNIAARYGAAAESYLNAVAFEYDHKYELHTAECEGKPPPSPPELPVRHVLVEQGALPDAVEACVRFGHDPEDAAVLEAIRTEANEEARTRALEDIRHQTEV